MQTGLVQILSFIFLVETVFLEIKPQSIVEKNKPVAITTVFTRQRAATAHFIGPQFCRVADSESLGSATFKR
jgi:hypothetical protein